MGYRLGVDLGTTFTAAALRDGGPPSMLGLGNRALQIPSVLYLQENGQFLVGEAAERRAVTDPSRVVREFKRRIGDPIPLMVAGTPFSPQALSARLLSSVVATATERCGAPPDEVVLTYPANWGAYKRELVDQIISLADVGPTVTCLEPQAAAIQYAARARLKPGERVVVYDLGGGTFDVCVLEKTADGLTILGKPEGIEQLGGVDFDEAVFQHVVGALGAVLEQVDLDNDDGRTALTRLRRDCVEAKEALSVDVDTVIPVTLAGRSTSVRLTRAELESLIAPVLEQTVEATSRALREAGTTSDQLTAIVLVGGSSRIPLVSHLLQSRFSTPTALDTHPKHDTALGAVQFTPSPTSSSWPSSGSATPVNPTPPTTPPAPPHRPWPATTRPTPPPPPSNPRPAPPPAATESQTAPPRVVSEPRTVPPAPVHDPWTAPPAAPPRLPVADAARDTASHIAPRTAPDVALPKPITAIATTPPAAVLDASTSPPAQVHDPRTAAPAAPPRPPVAGSARDTECDISPPTAPDVASRTAPDMVSGTAPHVAPDVASRTAPDTLPDVASRTAPRTTPDVASRAAHRTAPDSAPHIAPPQPGTAVATTPSSPPAKPLFQPDGRPGSPGVEALDGGPRQARRVSKRLLVGLVGLIVLAIVGVGFGIYKSRDTGYDSQAVGGSSSLARPPAAPSTTPNPTPTPTPRQFTPYELVTKNKLYTVGALQPSRCPEPAYRPTSMAAVQAYYNQMLPCLNRTWSAALKKAGLPFRAPHVVVYANTVKTACGVATRGYYCGSDETIYLQFSAYYNNYKTSPMYIRGWMLGNLPRMYGYHVQYLAGILDATFDRQRATTDPNERLLESRKRELQVLCLGAAYLGADAQFIPFKGELLSNWKNVIAISGDEASSPKVRDHGASANQTYWSNRGLTHPNPNSCNTFLSPPQHTY